MILGALLLQPWFRVTNKEKTTNVDLDYCKWTDVTLYGNLLLWVKLHKISDSGDGWDTAVGKRKWIPRMYISFRVSFSRMEWAQYSQLSTTHPFVLLGELYLLGVKQQSPLWAVWVSEAGNNQTSLKSRNPCIDIWTCVLPSSLPPWTLRCLTIDYNGRCFVYLII